MKPITIYFVFLLCIVQGMSLLPVLLLRTSKSGHLDSLGILLVYLSQWKLLASTEAVRYTVDPVTDWN